MSTNITVHVGRNIRRQRDAKDWSQEYLAGKIGRRASWISRIENEHTHPTLPNLVLLARALGVTIDDLVTVRRS